jgi:hypothetical protein
MRTETPPGENFGLLSGAEVRRNDMMTAGDPSDVSSDDMMAAPGNRSVLAAILASIGGMAVMVTFFLSVGSNGHDTSSLLRASSANILGDDSPSSLPVLGTRNHLHHHKKLQEEEAKDDGEENGVDAAIAMPNQRCEWVVDLFTAKNKGKDEEELKEQYAVQSADPNIFYRATANIFWIDFVKNGWHDRITFDTIGINARQFDGTPLQRRSTWTWVTGDQHLSNFGAWKNRAGEVVFSVNDFDVSSSTCMQGLMYVSERICVFFDSCRLVSLYFLFV